MNSTPSPARRLALALFILLSTLVVDQWTKKLAYDGLERGRVYEYAGGMLRVQYAENTGAFLGLGKDLDPHTRFLLLTVATGLFLVALAIYGLLQWRMDLAKFLGVQAILAGGIGNLIDRIRSEGSVIDFLNLGFGDLRVTGIFNVADIAITGGAVLLLLLSFRREPEETPQEASAS